jgi:hypothetical protein
MQIKNVDGSLRKTMVAVFKKQGLPEKVATAKAAKHLGAAKARFNEAQAQSVKASPAARRDDIQARLKDRRKSAARVVGHERRTGPSIKTASKRVTSAEQVALRKVSSAPATNAFLMAKTGASVAIGLGAVAAWAKSLP